MSDTEETSQEVAAVPQVDDETPQDIMAALKNVSKVYFQFYRI